MAIQLFVNGLIMFFYSKIYADKHKEQLAKEVVQTFAADISNTTDQLIKLNISNSYHNYLSALSFQLSENDNNKLILPKQNDVKKIGFECLVKQTDDERNNATVITDSVIKDKTAKNTIAVLPCKYCGNMYQQRIYTQLFCCNEHKQKWHRENKGFDLDLYKKRKK